MASPLLASTARHQALGIAILRVITGITFTAHGYQKVFVYGMAGVQDAFTKMGAPMPMITCVISGSAPCTLAKTF